MPLPPSLQFIPSASDGFFEAYAEWEPSKDFAEELDEASPEEAAWLLKWFDWAETWDPMTDFESSLLEEAAEADNGYWK